MGASMGLRVRHSVRLLFAVAVLTFCNGAVAAETAEATWHRCRVMIPVEWKPVETTLDLGTGREGVSLLINGEPGTPTAPKWQPGREISIALRPPKTRACGRRHG